MSDRLTQLSRTIAYALRHKPDRYGLMPNDQGWVDLVDLVSALRAHEAKWREISTDDIRLALEVGDKQRFELLDHRIRALYGHSLAERIEMEATVPPDTLFHGTTKAVLQTIRMSGLKPMQRQYVHLSPDVETAAEVGRRRTRRPVIITVHAARAAQSGCLFYQCNSDVWLSDSILPKHLTFPDH